MSTDRQCIESYMDAANLTYFTREQDSIVQWILFFAEGGVAIRFDQADQILLIRSLALVKLDAFTEPQRANLLRQLLRRNNHLLVGHYCADAEVYFEVSLPLGGSQLTANQFHRCLAVVISELEYFAESKEALAKGELPSFSVEQLMRRLLHSPQTEAGTNTETNTETPPATRRKTRSREGKRPPVEHNANEDLSFQVVLTKIGESKRQVIESLKQSVGRPRTVCKKIVEAAPTPIGRWKTRSEAEAVVRHLTAAGATAVII